MLIGYNNDVQYRSMTFHIQTEDRGTGNETIESQLFSGGQILDTKITRYTEYLVGLEGDERDKKLKALMQASHRSLFKKLMAGEYNALVGLEPVEGEDPEVAVEDFTPSQERVPAGAALVEEEGEDAFHDPSGGQYVDLSQLNNKLSALGSTGSDDGDGLEEESNGPATQVMSLPPDMNPSTSKIESLKQGAANDRVEAEQEADAASATAPKEAETPRETKASIARTAPLAAIPRPMTMPRPKISTNKEGIPNLRTTGVRAWQGFEPPAEDLSIVSMVEAFLQL